MIKPPHLPEAARSAHALALEVYRFTAAWPASDRDGLTLEVRRIAHTLASCLDGASARPRCRSLDRALDQARQMLSRLEYFIRLASDVGYRKLATSSAMDQAMIQLAVDLDVVTWERSGGFFEKEGPLGNPPRKHGVAFPRPSGRSRRRRRHRHVRR